MQEIKEYAEQKKLQLKEEVSKLGHIKAVVVQIGNNDASNVYVRNKKADLEQVGIECQVMKYPENTSEDGLLFIIKALNQDKKVDGYIIQMPLPKQINEEHIKLAIDPKKDIDGFNYLSTTQPCTPLGIYNYLKDMNYEFEGKNCVVIGRSNIVGKPMAKMLLNANMNVTILHSKTNDTDKKRYIRNADLIIVATGHRHTITKSFVLNKEAIIFDVGINRDENNKLCGDVDYEDVANKVAFLSPVPNGCGKLTKLGVIENLIALKKAQ